MFILNKNEKIRFKMAVLVMVVLMMSVSFLCACGENPEILQEAEVYDFKLYFANSDYVETGDENLGVYIVDARTMEVQKGENPWIVLLEDLKNPGSDQLWTAVDFEIAFNDVYIDEDDREVLIVDLGGVSPGGSLKESIFIGQLVKTAIANSSVIFEDSLVERVLFLVDGEVVESLMGHFESFGPFGMEDI